MLSETILSQKHQQAGLELTEDNHCVYLLHHGEVVAVFSAQGCTPESLREEADRLAGITEWEQRPAPNPQPPDDRTNYS
jgi:hypothetical protein